MGSLSQQPHRLGHHGDPGFRCHDFDLVDKSSCYRNDPLRDGGSIPTTLFPTIIHLPSPHEREEPDASRNHSDGDNIQHYKRIPHRRMAFLCRPRRLLFPTMAHLPTIHHRDNHLPHRYGNQHALRPRDTQSPQAGRQPPLHTEKRDVPLCHCRQLFRRVYGMGRLRNTHVVAPRTRIRVMDLRQPRAQGTISPQEIYRRIRTGVHLPSSEIYTPVYLLMVYG